MRVTAGTAGGLRLASVPGEDVRPTADKVKQAVFNMLQFEIEGRLVVDLFAGTGQLAIEALSRGASFADLADNSPKAAAVIRQNLAATKLVGKAKVHLSDYKPFLKAYPAKRCHILFLDPPYRAGFLLRILKFVQTFDIMAPNGIIICEGASDEVLPQEVCGFVQENRKVYGAAAITKFRNVIQGE